MKTYFRASGIDYVFEVVRGSEIIFYLETGYTGGSAGNLIIDEMGYELSLTRTVNSIANPFAVFSKVREITMDYVLNNKLRYFSFSGDQDRLKIYTRFAKSFRQYGYDYTFHKGYFTFYKVQ